MKKAPWFIVAYSLLVCAGCGAQGQVTDLKGDTIHLRAQLQVLQDRVATRADVDSLLRYIGHLEQMIKDQNDVIWSMRAELNQQLSTLDDRQQVLDAKLLDSRRQVSGVSQTVEGAKTPLISTKPDSAKKTDPRAVYNTSLSDYQQGDYELALRGFTQYLAYLPASELSDDAQYWIGDCYYNQKKYPQAQQALEELLNRFSDSNKIPATLLRLAFVRLALNDGKTAKAYLERVVKEFPNAEEATLAKMRLDTLPGK